MDHPIHLEITQPGGSGNKEQEEIVWIFKRITINGEYLHFKQLPFPYKWYNFSTKFYQRQTFTNLTPPLSELERWTYGMRFRPGLACSFIGGGGDIFTTTMIMMMMTNSAVGPPLLCSRDRESRDRDHKKVEKRRTRMCVVNVHILPLLLWPFVRLPAWLSSIHQCHIYIFLLSC